MCFQRSHPCPNDNFWFVVHNVKPRSLVRRQVQELVVHPGVHVGVYSIRVTCQLDHVDGHVPWIVVHKSQSITVANDRIIMFKIVWLSCVGADCALKLVRQSAGPFSSWRRTATVNSAVEFIISESATVQFNSHGHPSLRPYTTVGSDRYRRSLKSLATFLSAVLFRCLSSRQSNARYW